MGMNDGSMSDDGELCSAYGMGCLEVYLSLEKLLNTLFSLVVFINVSNTGLSL